MFKKSLVGKKYEYNVILIDEIKIYSYKIIVVAIAAPAETEVMVSQLCLMCGSTLNCQTLCLGARPRYNLVVEVDVKKPTNQQLLPYLPTTEVVGRYGQQHL